MREDDVGPLRQEAESTPICNVLLRLTGDAAQLGTTEAAITITEREEDLIDGSQFTHETHTNCGPLTLCGSMRA